jgi:N-acetylneuraminic acid mutarotase
MAPLGGKLNLFGGHDATLAFVADTWAWDGSAWTQLMVTGPPGRDGATMAPLDDKLVLFGGFNDSGPLSDTWTWDGTSWAQLNVTGPSARQSATMAALDGKLVLFGGNAALGAYFGQSLSDTWTWDGASWTEQMVARPSPRAFAVMAAR